MIIINKIYTEDEIRKEFSVKGLEVYGDLNYINLKTKFNAQDTEGYRYWYNLISIRKVKIMERFSLHNPHTIYNIKLWLKLNDPDYQLLSTEYKGTEDKLEFVQVSRPDLGSFFTSWHMFYTDGNRHPKLRFIRNSDSKRRKPKEVRSLVNKILLENFPEWSLVDGEEDKYRNPKTNLKFIHNEGYKSISSFEMLNKKTELFLFNNRFPEESMYNMKIWTEKNSKYKVVEGQEYNYFRGKYKFICDIHGEFINNFSTIYSYDTGCQKCIVENLIGENNPNWNPNLTDEDRKRSRNITGYGKFISNVLERDNYTCQCCGNENTQKLVVHHKDAYHWCKERRIDESNGIVLCEDCHIEFHKTYGYQNCTELQFEDFLKNKTTINT